MAWGPWMFFRPFSIPKWIGSLNTTTQVDFSLIILQYICHMHVCTAHVQINKTNNWMYIYIYVCTWSCICSFSPYVSTSIFFINQNMGWLAQATDLWSTWGETSINQLSHGKFLWITSCPQHLYLHDFRLYSYPLVI